MARKTNSQIREKWLILCEGRDAEEFLISYLNSHELSDIPAFSEDFQVMDFGGITDLTDFISALQRMENYDRVEAILIIRDAEGDPEAAKSSIQASLSRNDCAIPHETYVWSESFPKIGYLLFPTCDKDVCEGAIEHLCMDILSEENSDYVISDIEKFMYELGKRHGREYPHDFKTKLHTYFSVTDKYVSLKIGEAAKAGAFNWNSPKLLPLKNFLLEIINADTPE